VFATGRPTVSDLFFGVAVRRPVIAIDVPVKRVDGAVAYVLALNPGLDDFERIIRRQQLPDDRFTAVFDRHGITVARVPGADQFIGRPAAPEFLPLLLDHQEGVIETETHEGVPVIAVFSHAGQFGWSVGIGVPRATLIDPAIQAALRTLGVAGIVLAIGLMLALLVARQVTRPIAALRRLAAATDGEASPGEPRTGLRETDEVAHALRAAEARRKQSEGEERRALAMLHQEVTERRRAEAQLRLFIDAAPAAIAMFDRDMRYLAVSRRFREDYRLGDQPLIGRSHYELFPEMPERWREIHRRCLAGATERCDEEAFARADGETDWLRWEIRPWQDEPDAVGGIVLFSEVITGRKRAELALHHSDAMLRQAQKMEAIGQLTGGLAHDFNNLLLVVIGNLEMLLDGEPSDADIREFANEALDAAQRGAELNRSLLAFARQQPLQPRRVDVNQLVDGITKLLSRTLGERIKMLLELAPDTWPVVVDPAQLQAALANLANNARDAMPKGGRLTVTTANRVLDDDYVAEHADVTAGDYAMIEVGDNGTGMPPTVVAKIFEPFFTTKPRGEGTGLGLSMVFGFIKQSGGHIAVYSEPGVGTAFRLYLPRDKRDGDGLEPETMPTAPLGNGEIVLIVEDDAAIRRLVVRLLTGLGYQVRETENAARAIALLEGGERIDLLFSDVVMAGKLDGYELARVVTERWPSTRVILTSGFPSATMDPDSLPSHAIRLLTKPYRKEDLAHALRDALDGRGGSSSAEN
jgi:PAS domain S-box-containing protein